MRTYETKFDVSDLVDIGEEAYVEASLHLPSRLYDRVEILFCLAGGGYRRSYWHPTYADPGYSFARYFTDRGKAVICVDHLGMGDSTKPLRESNLSRAKIAAANAEALRQAALGMQNGTFSRARELDVTGVGHSIGGCMLITQAAAHGGFARAAILGWANQPAMLHNGLEEAHFVNLMPPEGYIPNPPQLMRPLFYGDSVPEHIMAADEAAGTETPVSLARDATTASIVDAESASLTMPIFTMHSAIDTSPDPWKEPAFFRGSNDVTLYVLEGAAHCHNFAPTRFNYWARLNRWITDTQSP
jgi:pimeloyl-ACP methyl ester carboxylesterase